jgi:hypothetical protein
VSARSEGNPREDPKPKGRPGGSDKPKGRPGGMSPTARRHARRRKEQLDLIREQVKDGTLVIRQMTPEEREKYPPRPRKPKRSNRKR